ncbi:AraC family transcriptional regulator [Paracoccus sp. p3-h83]|uniref:AraC family transcriptional regulator n=1 Tax=Paracoccus sp. p3-h83 TaxID=3342805 RepID=UPI0035B871CE
MERRSITPGFVWDALACLAAQGLDARPILAAAGLDGPPVAPVSSDQYGALWLAMADAMQDEFFGLAARPMRPGSFALMGHAVLDAPNLGRALRRALRFLNVVLDQPQGRLAVQDGQAVVILTDGDGLARPAFAYRSYWLILLGLACWLVGRRIPLLQVDFRGPPPPHRRDYHQFFGAPVRFDRPDSRVIFAARYLDLPIHRSPQALRQFLRGAPANILVRYRHDQGLAARLRGQLRARPPAAWPVLEEMAAALSLSPATLRRRLRAEGHSYAGLKDEIRLARAQALLTGGDLPVAEIAAELGYSEPSAFHRAFRNWTGTSPGAFRAAAR